MERKNGMFASSLGTLMVSPYLVLAYAALFWSGNFIVGRALQGEISAVPLNFWRWVVALAILLPLSYSQLRDHRSLFRSEWKIIVSLGLTGIAGFHICVYMALATTTAINALLFFSVAPMAIVFASWLTFRDKMTFIQVLGIIVSLFGAIALIARGNLDALVNLQFNTGDLWMLLAVSIWTAYSILLKRRPPQIPQLALLTGSVIAGLILMMPVYVWSIWEGQRISINGPNILAILYIGIFASALAFFFWNKGVAQIGPNKAGMFIHLMPVFGTLLSILFLGEGIATFHVIGAVFVFSGIALTNWQQLRTST